MTRNNEVKVLADRAKFYIGDREACMDFAKLLAYVSKKSGVDTESGVKWDLVVDFSAFKRKAIKSVVRGLSHLVKLYVFISTDSVYEVSVPEIREGFVKESDALRPEKDEDIRKSIEVDDYGHHKLRCEEYLKSHSTRESLPYVVLRCPDIIGPYNANHHYWIYFTWLMHMQNWPVQLHLKADSQKLSFVFSEDVAGFIHTFLPRIASPDGCKFVDGIHGEAFNLAVDEVVTFKELLTLMVG